MIRSVTRGLAALMVLLVLLVGLPAALWTLGRQWLPDRLPSVEEITATLGRPDDGSLFLGALVVIGFLAWACFAVSVIVELPAQLGWIRAVRVPVGMRWSQHLAGGLLAAVLSMTLVPALAASAAPAYADPPPAPVSVAEAVPSPQASPAPWAAPTAEPAAATYTVGHHDTLWQIAEETLGDGMRYPQIAALNRGVLQPDGGALSDGDVIREGWVLALPPDAGNPAPGTAPMVERAVVQRGDTLAGIAAAEGLPGWRPIFELNAGEPQPGGRVFTDPDLIFPGQVLDLPAAAGQPLDPPTTQTPAEPQPVPPAGYDGPQDLPIPAPPATDAGHDAADRSGSGARAGEAGDRGDDAAGEADAAVVDESAAADGLPVPALYGAAGGGLLAAGAAAALLVHRRRRLRRLGPGRMVVPPPAGLAPVEKQLLAAAAPATQAYSFLDLALRSLMRALAEDDAEEGRLPDVLGARLTEARLDLRLAAPHPVGPPAPWTADESGWWWSVRRDAALPVTAATAARYVAPYPALVTVGANDDGQWLIDLERAGAVTVSGPRQRGEDLVRCIGAELALNSWSDWQRVILCGVGAELAELCPERLTRIDDFGKAAGQLRQRLGEGLAEMAGGDPGPLQARRRNVGADAWYPEVLLVGGHPGGGELAELLGELAGSGRAAAAVVVTGEDVRGGAAEWRCELDEQGQLRIPALDVQVLARQMSAQQASDVAALMRFYSDGPDIATPPARGDAPWQAFSDVGGGLLPAHTLPREDAAAAAPGDPTAMPPGRAAVPESVLPQATDSYLTSTATTAEDVEAMARRIPAGLRRRVTEADPTLDEDLAAWRTAECALPRLTVLGPVRLRAIGDASASAVAKREPWLTELVAYLWSRPHGASADELVTALWPEDAALRDEVNNAQSLASLARSWLGNDPATGQPHLSKAYKGRPYQLRGLLVDADLFGRLRLRGEASGRDGLDDLVAALELVTGRPFEQRRPGGYQWLVDNPLDHAYAKAVADVAHIVATAKLAAADPAAALLAGEVALLAGGCDDRAMLDSMQACFAEGNATAAEQWVTRIRRLYSYELDEDLPPRTFEIITRCRRQYAAASRAS